MSTEQATDGESNAGDVAGENTISTFERMHAEMKKTLASRKPELQDIYEKLSLDDKPSTTYRHQMLKLPKKY